MKSTSSRARAPMIALPERMCAPGAPCLDRLSDWFTFKNVADDVVEILIYDAIVDRFEEEFFGVGVSAAGFVEQLQEMRGRPLNVRIDSPGGLVFGGIAIANALRAHDARVDVFVDGGAFSIASVIALAGDSLTMRPGSMLMIHEAQGITIGGPAEHAKQLEVLNKLSDNIAAAYSEAAGGTMKSWRAKMAAETWFTDKEAVEAGLADRIDSAASLATNKFDLSRFKNAPAALVSAGATSDAPTKRQVEDALRDVGLSGREAKTVLSACWNVLAARDEPLSEEWLLEEEPPVVVSGTEITDPEPKIAGADGESPETDDIAAIYANLQRVCTIHGFTPAGV